MIDEHGPSKKMEMATFLSLKCGFCKGTVETYSSYRCEGTKAFEVYLRSVSAVTGKCLIYNTLNKSFPKCSRWQSQPDTEEKQK